MKNRIKKFYKDHEHVVLPITVGVATFVAFAYSINHIVEGKDVERMQRRIRDDGRMEVRAVLRNGQKTQTFTWLDQVK